MAAIRKNLAYRFLKIAKISSQTPTPFSSRPAAAAAPAFLKKLLPKPQSRGRFLFQSAAVPPANLSLPTGDKLIDRIRGLGGGYRIRLDGVAPPARSVAEGISVEEVRKVLKASQMEAVRARVKAMERSCVSYSEFVQICCEAAEGFDQGLGIAKSLDESGAVIVLGNVVYLRPDQVAKAIESVIPALSKLPHPNDPRRQELKAMEEKKAAIDEKAEVLVKRELWCGLGLLTLQTAGFMRLTFWELSWDVMEPICFYVTSIYFMAGYAFFLRTSRDPSFEGFFQSRFAAKQKRLMKATNFDVRKFNELRKACLGPDAAALPNLESCGCHVKDNTFFGVTS